MSYMLVVYTSCPVERYIGCLNIMLSTIVPQEVIDGDCINFNLFQSDVFWIVLQQPIDFLHYKLSQQTQQLCNICTVLQCLVTVNTTDLY